MSLYNNLLLIRYLALEGKEVEIDFKFELIV
jgi:hypothetical protein